MRKAQERDLPGVERIYDEIHSAEEQGLLSTGWLRGVYPTGATARTAWELGDLFVLEEDGEVLGAARINQSQLDVYRDAPWEHVAADGEVCVLHTLVISPRAAGRGYGTRCVRFYEDYARSRGWLELRIDTNSRNAAARALYKKLGYREISIVPTIFNGIPQVDLVLLEKHLDPG